MRLHLKKQAKFGLFSNTTGILQYRPKRLLYSRFSVSDAFRNERMIIFFALSQLCPGIGLRINCKMMKTVTLLVCMCFGSMAITSGQTFQFLDVIQNGIGLNEPVIATDPMGNTYMAAEFTNEIEIGGLIITTDDYQSSFLAKFDKNGTIIWLKPIATTGKVSTLDLVYNKATNGVLLSGDFFGDVVVDSVLYSNPDDIDGIWISYDASGEIIATNTIDGSAYELFVNIGADKTGNIYVSALVQSDSASIDGIPQVTGGENYSTIISKFNPAGVLLWSRAITADGPAVINDLTVAANGTIYFAFSETGSYYYHSSPEDSYGFIKDPDERNIIVAAYAKNGTLINSAEFPANAYASEVADISFDGSINLAINFMDTISIYGETFIADTYATNVLAVRLNANTFFPEWIKHIYSPYYFTADAIKSVKESVVIAGHYQNYGEIDGFVIENPLIDFESYLATFSKLSGTTLGLADFDNEDSWDQISDIDADKKGNIYLVGTFTDDIYFDGFHGTCEPGADNIFFTRLNATILREGEPESTTPVKLYPNPATTNITATTPMVNWQIMNMQGQVILSAENNNPTVSIEIAALPAGVYLLSFIDTQNQLVSAQFIKQ